MGVHGRARAARIPWRTTLLASRRQSMRRILLDGRLGDPTGYTPALRDSSLGVVAPRQDGRFRRVEAHAVLACLGACRTPAEPAAAALAALIHGRGLSRASVGVMRWAS